ncbi:MAG: hypothetical protein WCJ30_28510, partial [Deltaproteobacteria bacterium]
MLLIHSIARWIVIALGLVACGRAMAGWLGKRDWTPADNRAGLVFMVSIDLQILIGVVLYFAFSPLANIALQNFGAAMRDSTLRFYAVEHATLG